jgi:hypothetical protein
VGGAEMMGIRGFKTKKALKAAIGTRPSFIETSIFGREYVGDDTYVVVGPDPYSRKWFAQVTIENGRIKRVD